MVRAEDAVPAFQRIPHGRIQVNFKEILPQDGVEGGIPGYALLRPAVIRIHIVIAHRINHGNLQGIQHPFVDFLEGGNLRGRCGIHQVSHHQHTRQVSLRGLLQLGKGLLEFLFRAIPVPYVRIADDAQGKDNLMRVKTRSLRLAGKQERKG